LGKAGSLWEYHARYSCAFPAMGVGTDAKVTILIYHSRRKEGESPRVVAVGRELKNAMGCPEGGK